MTVELKQGDLGQLSTSELVAMLGTLRLGDKGYEQTVGEILRRSVEFQNTFIDQLQNTILAAIANPAQNPNALNALRALVDLAKSGVPYRPVQG